VCKQLGLETGHPSQLKPEALARQKSFVRLMHKVRFPLHDHCRKNMKWSNAQVLVRFVLIQAFLTPTLFVILIKIR
jgi:UDP-N-acetylmuramyl pentapeptide phosphotransferase/UDP-N-acetylglucosamine-1-phosphate transferase